MGKTAFSGPVYGAKGVLFSYGPATVSSGASTALVGGAMALVPPYEDWFVTELGMTCSSNSSNFSVKLKAQGTNAGTIATATSGASTALTNVIQTATVTAGEYEGFWVPANSTLRAVSSGVNPAANVLLTVHGFKRFVSSTRAEA